MIQKKILMGLDFNYLKERCETIGDLQKLQDRVKELNTNKRLRQ